MVSEILGTIAVIGNPNVGKTTLFNALTGLNQRIGNYSGVTVEKKTGYFSCQNQTIALSDLPGMYSLSAHSLDERIALDHLVGKFGTEHDKIQGILVIVDASHLQRNLYLFSQLSALKLPMVLALNMIDMAKRTGITIHSECLAQQLKVPVVPVQANVGVGLEELKLKILEMLQGKIACPHYTEAEQFHPPYTTALQRLQQELPSEVLSQLHPFQIERILVDPNGYYETQFIEKFGNSFQDKLQKIRQQTESEKPLSAQEAESRYQWIETKLKGALDCSQEKMYRFSDRLDALLVHRFFGPLFFILLMLLLFQSIYTWASPLMDWIESSFGNLGGWVGNYLPEGAVKSLVVDGIFAGIGGVLIFLPQILILFFFLAILEDCGYMARAAFLMDRVMFHFGLSGKSFIPLLSSFACAIPGIMASRVITNRQDRLITILVAPLMSCSARLPVYTILIAAFIPPTTLLGFFNLQGLVLFAAYALGAITAVFMALLFKKTILKGSATPFVMELPDYQWPNLRTIFFRMYEAGVEFVQRAGTIIFAITLIIWAMAYYPRNTKIDPNVSENEQLSQQLENSFLARLGKTIQPMFAPLGWDWKISTAAIASFPAREVIVATMGIIYSLGSEEDESSESLRDALKNSKNPDGSSVFNIPVALSILVFFALCAQCGATLAIIKRETMSWKWPLFTFVYMTTLAYLGGLVTYQLGMLCG